MRVISLKANRIILHRDDISIDGSMVIEPDDPTMDMKIQHIPSTSKVSELPAPMQAAINNLFALCDGRLVKQERVTLPNP